MRTCRAIAAATLGGLLVLPVAGFPAAGAAPDRGRTGVVTLAATVRLLPEGRLRVNARTDAVRVSVRYVVLGRTTRSLSVPVRRGAVRVTLPQSATSVRVRGAASAGRRATAWQHLVIPPRSPQDVAPAAETVAAWEQELLDLVNQVRATGATCPDGQVMAPAPALARDAQLDSAARAHAAWQARTGIMSHTGAGGSTLGVRISAAGFPWSRAAEVVAVGWAQPAEALARWLGSTGHCHALLDPDVTRTGIAHAYSSTSVYRHFWTQDLARP